ncbi:hypothetical protein PM082_008491 [Marasmius tenuissimus]|nr:hypothetical protein PM082_008491 [Marasmius tenuissimus]
MDEGGQQESTHHRNGHLEAYSGSPYEKSSAKPRDVAHFLDLLSRFANLLMLMLEDVVQCRLASLGVFGKPFGLIE